jgi:cysteine dioxygenase
MGKFSGITQSNTIRPDPVDKLGSRAAGGRPVEQGLQELLAKLDRCTGRVPLDLLTEDLQKLTLQFEDVRAFARFGVDTYRRNLIRQGRAYQALLLCWRYGQRSPIHDHRGSSCGVRVIKGEAMETLFDRTSDGLVYATGTRTLVEGISCGSQDNDIHQVSNLQSSRGDLITLHVYSPPLLTMHTYSLTDPIVREMSGQVCDVEHGAGM